MDILFKQLRTKNPNLGQESKEGISSTARDRTVPPQKTQSFKERKRSQSWLRRQFSGSMSKDDEPINEGEYQTAVAAAAFAVKSLEETRRREERKGRHIPDAALPPMIKSNTDDAAPVPDRRTKSIKFSADEIAMPNLEDPDRRVQIRAETTEKMPEKEVIPAPPTKKKLSFADTQPEVALPSTSREAIRPTKKAPSFEKTYSRKPEFKESKPETPSPVLPPFLPGDPTIMESLKKPGIGDNQAEVWERREISRIKEKYEKLRAKILEWEQKKKTKAKRRLERTEAELDKRRARAMQHYRSELDRIEGIVKGARSQATENQRNEESKAKVKANKIRLTGKLPASCWCF